MNKQHFHKNLISKMFWVLLIALSFSFNTIETTFSAPLNVVPEDMAYIPFGLGIMGIDKDPKNITSVKSETPTLYERRMSMPWSKAAFQDEGPAHWVLLSSYLIDKYEVSNQKFAKFMKATGHAAPAYWDDPRLNGDSQPVVGVNWYDAKAYCEWEGKRLPTEAEWENAARGPEGLLYPWGNSFDADKVNNGKRRSSTMPIDSLKQAVSPYGLHHMAGNVFEWVSDWYDPNYYSKGPFQPNPSGPPKGVWLGGTGTYVDRLTVGEKKVVRGGSWIAGDHTVTTTHRFWNHPLNNSYGVGLGFRCALTASQEIEDAVQTYTINAMKEVGMERYKEAGAYIDQALKVDPRNENLLRLRDIVKKGKSQS
jgi:formylglycine-generating enzyme required for sulfatase activity